MDKREEISKMLDKMTKKTRENYKLIDDCFSKLGYDKSEYLNALTSDKYEDVKCFMAIVTLLLHDHDPNTKDDKGNNFIQIALYEGYSEEFILTCIVQAARRGLDVNSVNEKGDTMLHTAMYSTRYKGKVCDMYNLLCELGFDSTIKNNAGYNVLFTLRQVRAYAGHFDDEELADFTELYEQKMNEDNETVDEKEIEFTPIVKTKASKKKEEISDSDKAIDKYTLQELERYGTVLNYKEYFSDPAIGRDEEVMKLMISLAQDKKNPIIVGQSGVGKTAIVDQLAYNISKGNVPKFLKDKIILEVSPSELVAGCKYVGQFEEKLNRLMEAYKKYGFIMFIDEIHTMYGVGTTENKTSDMSAMIKHYIDRLDLKVIGTTTEEEYQEFFAHDALKRRFEKIIVEEPDEELLEIILDKVMSDCSEKSGLKFESEEEKKRILDIIINATSEKHRVYNDRVNNPDLAISIIDKAFAMAKVFDHEFVTALDFANSLSYCDRLYDSIRENASNKLKASKKENSKPHECQIVEIDPFKYKR